MDTFHCPICNAKLGEPTYRSAGASSIDSLCRILPFETKVHCCPDCSHVSTEPIPDLERYYAENYGISLGSEDDDQLYEMIGSTQVFRTEHQARLLVDLVDWKPGAKALDFGCAKASTWRKALPDLPGVELSLYDVSRDYLAYWDGFVPANRQAIDEIPHDWRGYFDLVTSFFSLEHIAAIRPAVADIASVLREGGDLYLVVPDMFTNACDFVVLDHANHFTQASLSRLLAEAGLMVRWIRNDVHRSALVASARKTSQPIPVPPALSDGDPTELGRWWSGVPGRIRTIEQGCSEDVAIYGAGFYGSFIYSSLEHPQRVRCFLDNNPHLQGKAHLGVPVLRPADCPPSVRDLWIGLNPLESHQIMGSVDLGKASPRQHHLAEK